MTAYLVRRDWQAVPILVAVNLLTFALFFLVIRVVKLCVE